MSPHTFILYFLPWISFFGIIYDIYNISLAKGSLFSGKICSASEWPKFETVDFLPNRTLPFGGVDFNL